MSRKRWTPRDDALMHELYPSTTAESLAVLFATTPRSVYARARTLGLSKPSEWIRATARARSGPSHPMSQYHYPKGHRPWNAGLRGVGGKDPACVATQFKPGSKPHTWRPVGTLTINADGYLDIKVADLRGPRHLSWHGYHRHVWEQAHGPVPPGHIVVFKPGRRSTDPAQITLDAIELITRAQLMQRNTIHNQPPHIKAALSAIRSLTRRINRMSEDSTHEQP